MLASFFNWVHIFNRHFVQHNCIFKQMLYLCIYIHSFCAENIYFFHAEEPTEEKKYSCVLPDVGRRDVRRAKMGQSWSLLQCPAGKGGEMLPLPVPREASPSPPHQ